MPNRQTKNIVALLLLATLATLILTRERPPKTAPVPGRPIDVTLAISVAELQARLQKNENVILVDVRPAAEFANAHIPNSINIPTYLLKTKTFMKTQPVILINEGYDRQELEAECQRLRPLGFTWLSILSGGLVAWHENGSKLQGDPFAARKLAIVPPRSFFLERQYSHRLVVDIGSTPTKEQPAIIPEAVHFADDGGQGLIAKLKKVLADQDRTLLHSLLLFNDDGQGYEALDRRLNKAGLGPIFYLDGGRAGYKAFLDSQAPLQQPQKLSTDNKTCPTCP